ncbi:MAG: QVPTGV class sortase B protein-sorting domain-containing protein [Candidatus Heimdallarchaeum aukensis]|uniref:QVPTGV class sortase B protein-sorting domain-containing protein n=1 Tax=Candidatus Heimdallarchaeum aukensis TaxID=2876573 RepID=A0A9Y1BN64_9ARCH|nr:MAG: QVPTGV class sortase B protein-sorting domain-containing protein [Candidatus Heimdallarchaeum aukensis]
MNFLKRFKKTFHITFWEAVIALTVIIVFFILRYTLEHITVPIIILGFLVGIWLAFRPSEWAVEGLNSSAKYVGLSEYVAGIFSSLASNLPEAVIAVMLLLKGQELIAVITVLSAAGFNTLILGFAILVATWKKWEIKVPADLEKKESPLIRWAIVALLMTAVFGIIEYIHVLDSDSFVLTDAKLTKPVASLLALSYVIYLVFIIGRKEEETEKIIVTDDTEMQKVDDDKEEKDSKSHKKDNEELLSKPMTILMLVMGFTGIFFGGESLTWCVEELLHGTTSFELSPITIALILGAAGAVPEHGIAIVSAIKHDIDVALGNSIGGILQSALLIFGILGMIISITLHPFIVLQLTAIAGVLWFVKRCIHDGKFDTFEAVMIILIQILIFVILFEDISIFE